MKFIEQFFGLSPDGGSGATEIGYLFAALGVAGLLVVARFLRKRPS